MNLGTITTAPEWGKLIVIGSPGERLNCYREANSNCKSLLDRSQLENQSTKTVEPAARHWTPNQLSESSLNADSNPNVFRIKKA